jgi:predicted nucleic acid-binding protein
MSAAEPAQFVDSNILVYAFDHAAGRKSTLARSRVIDLWQRGGGCVSIQVLQEFFVSVTAKISKPLTAPEASREIAYLSRWRVHRPGSSDVLSAIALHEDLRVSFWDAMILQSARRMGCRTLWTEDLGDGQTYEGVTVRNPFA